VHLAARLLRAGGEGEVERGRRVGRVDVGVRDAGDVCVVVVRRLVGACPALPPSVEERIADNRAQTFADFVMYREALATAAEERGWSVRWYDRERVPRDAAAVLGCEDVSAFLHAMGRSIGPPWQARHRLAAAAAIAATARLPERECEG
jgi:hypothetical protein